MKIIELFAGIGGFAKGFQNAGYEFSEHYYSEIDKHAIANYQYNYPHATYIGDVKSVQPEGFANIDIVTFGSPCFVGGTQVLSLFGFVNIEDIKVKTVDDL